MNIRRGIFLIIATLPLLAALAYGFGRDPRAVPSMLVGQQAPKFELTTLDGERLALAELKGSVVLLNFWATWCYPCQAEHDLLQAAARRAGSNARVFGIVYEDTPEAVRAYIAEHGSAYPQLIDPNSRVAIDFGVAGVPESFIIDANGVIAHKQAGIMRPEILQTHFFSRVP